MLWSRPKLAVLSNSPIAELLLTRQEAARRVLRRCVALENVVQHIDGRTERGARTLAVNKKRQINGISSE